MDPAKMDNKNTLKKTAFDLRIVRAYLAKVKEARELLSIPVHELDAHLATFLRSHRKQDGSEYEPGTLRGILGSLDRHFEKSNYPYAIYRSKDTRFPETVRAMKEKQSYLKTIGKGQHPQQQQAEVLSEREIELLYSGGTIGLHSPGALLHMLFFNIGLHFSLRSSEQHALKWGDISLRADSRGRKYLEHIKKLTLGRGPGHPHPSQTMRMQIYESPEQPERDVVKAYEKYAAERPEKMKHKDSPFYLAPQQDCRPGYARWFKNLPMGEARIRGIMKSLKVAASLAPVKKISDHGTMKIFNIRGNPGTLRVKTQREDTAVNGDCRVSSAPSALLPIKPDVDSYCPDDPPDTKPPCSEASVRKSNRHPSSRISNFNPGNRRRKKIKEEWEAQPNDTTEEADTGEAALYQGKVSVTFHDVAACFSAEEWGCLEDWQKELYKNAMREIHAALQAMGYAIMNSDVLLKIKENNEDQGSSKKPKLESDSACRGPVTPDIQLRIKQDHVPEWKADEVQEKEEELDTSNSILPVFDPDLSLWIFREEPNPNSSEPSVDKVLPCDTEAGTHNLHTSPSLYKDPVSDPAATYTPANPGGPRPGKRKRRPPQRRSSEQRCNYEDGAQMDSPVDPQHRLPYLNQTSEFQMDWLLHGRLYQCDLCDRSFSDRSIQFKTTDTGMVLSCPQCGGTLNLHPLFNRPPYAEFESSCAEAV